MASEHPLWVGGFLGKIDPPEGYIYLQTGWFCSGKCWNSYSIDEVIKHGVVENILLFMYKSFSYGTPNFYCMTNCHGWLPEGSWEKPSTLWLCQQFAIENDPVESSCVFPPIAWWCSIVMYTLPKGIITSGILRQAASHGDLLEDRCWPKVM